MSMQGKIRRSPAHRRGSTAGGQASSSPNRAKSSNFEDVVKDSILLSSSGHTADCMSESATASQSGGTMGSIVRAASNDSQGMELMDERQRGILKARLLAKHEAERIRNQTRAFDMIKAGQLGSLRDLQVHKGANDFRGNARTAGRPAHGREGGSYDEGGDHCQIDPGNPEMKLPFGVVHPYAVKRLLWDMVMFILLVYSTISIPVFLAFFENQTCSPNFLGQTSWFYVDFGVDMLFIVDIAITFRTAMIRKQHGDIWIVTRPRNIARAYIRGFFIIDVIASFPFELIIIRYCVPDANDSVGASSVISRGSRILKLFKIVRILRLLRVAKLQQFMSKIRDLLQLHPGIVRLCTFLIVVTLVSHYCACVFFYVGEAWLVPGGSLDEESMSWTTRTMFVQDANATHPSTLVSVHDLDSKFQQYVICLYWATMTMTTTGYGDVSPVTLPEMSFATIVIIIGGITYSFIIGNLAILLYPPALRPHVPRGVIRRIAHTHPPGHPCPETISPAGRQITNQSDIPWRSTCRRVQGRWPRFQFLTVLLVCLRVRRTRVMGGRYLNHAKVMEELENFMHRENMPLSLSMRIKSHKKQQYLIPSRLIPQFAAESMSSSLLRDFTMHIYRNTLSKLPLLSGLSESCLTAMALRLGTRCALSPTSMHQALIIKALDLETRRPEP